MGASIAQSHLPRPAKRARGVETTSDASAPGGPPARSSSVASGGAVGALDADGEQLLRAADARQLERAGEQRLARAPRARAAAPRRSRRCSGAARRSFTRNRSSLVANLILPVSARSFSSSDAACSVRRARSRQPLARRQAGALAVVEQAEAPLALVDEVVRAVADQHDARALRHVLVVGDVDRQLGQRALLDPAVEHRESAPRRRASRADSGVR